MKPVSCPCCKGGFSRTRLSHVAFLFVSCHHWADPTTIGYTYCHHWVSRSTIGSEPPLAPPLGDLFHRWDISLNATFGFFFAPPLAPSNSTHPWVWFFHRWDNHWECNRHYWVMILPVGISAATIGIVTATIGLWFTQPGFRRHWTQRLGRYPPNTFRNAANL